MRKETLFVAGTFNDKNGKSSTVASLINDGMSIDTHFINGGNFEELRKLLEKITDYENVIWLANVSNDKPKLINEIKERNPHCLLITSKRNVEKKYTVLDIINRLLFTRSNLGIEFQKRGDNYIARTIDPLGNIFCDFTEDMGFIGEVISKRIIQLKTFTRVKSSMKGATVEPPDEAEFYATVKDFAAKFHDLVHTNTDNQRLLGNASFRCERGFPSIKTDHMIFVSRRNIDKRFIDKDGFVAVPIGDEAFYYGENKPSVDTPIQVRLYDYYSKIKYMLHSHVYIKGAPFTDSVIPCGALEEADEIIKVFPDRTIKNFSINLRGHGSLVAADSVDFIKQTKYIPRKLPELQELE